MIVDDLINAWNATAKQLGLSPVRCLTEPRRKAANARLKESGPEAVQEALAAVGRSKFLLGQKNGNGHDGWKCNFDFFISARGFARILEGIYGNDAIEEKPQIDPNYAHRSKLEHFLKTGRWIGVGVPPTDKTTLIPLELLREFAPRFREKGIEIPALL